ncbi:hypothetical protein RUM43_008326 [Polyplax serrata]|uniref:Myb/SANT-like domain-containing protein n=1 Tax=Polyplax serrata TaxID=468196 RepID=A0AAN8P752_POLSC
MAYERKHEKHLFACKSVHDHVLLKEMLLWTLIKTEGLIGEWKKQFTGGGSNKNWDKIARGIKAKLIRRVTAGVAKEKGYRKVCWDKLRGAFNECSGGVRQSFLFTKCISLVQIRRVLRASIKLKGKKNKKPEAELEGKAMKEEVQKFTHMKRKKEIHEM